MRYVINKKDAIPKHIQWVLLLQEFNVELKDRKGMKNQVADHLSRLENSRSVENDEKIDMEETIPDEQMYAITELKLSDEKYELDAQLVVTRRKLARPWYANIANY